MAGKQRLGRHHTKFSIDDAFEEDADDAIRLYGSTCERAPLSKYGQVVGIDDVQLEMGVPDSPGPGKGLLTVPDVDAISRDSDSLIHGDNSSFYGTSEHPPWWFMHPKIKENWRIVGGAFILLFMGIGLIVMGVVVEALPIAEMNGWVFLISGLICFIPGAYHVVYVILAVKGRRGYDFYNLPLFN
ncbi:unnamed protein product [Meganyctiphanes norvegica]|uniref:Transmembrane protein 134 n=1 Tax=Meganyctiphanes norvegica TaxID=48144 RepID=A0AAV2QK14_MEGNR